MAPISILIIQAARQMLEWSARECGLDRAGVSESETILLLSLHHRQGQTQTEIAHTLARDKTTVSRSISKLSDQGLVRIEVDSLDGRRNNLFLTAAGHSLISGAAKLLEDAITAAASLLTVDELKAVEIFLETLESDR